MIRGVDQPILYNYPVQPYTYAMLTTMSKVCHMDLAFLSTMIAQVSLVLILFLSYFIVRRFKSETFAIAFIGVTLLIHEILISGAYYNTNITAMLFLYMAGDLLTRKITVLSTVTAAVLTAVAFFFRLDIVFMVPCLLAVLYFKKDIKNIFIFSTVFAISLLILGNFAHISIASIRSITQAHFEDISAQYSFPFKNTSLAMPLSIIILGIIGFWGLLSQRKYQAAIWGFLAIFPIFAFYFRGNTTPKYLLYIYPVMAWLALEGLIFLKRFQNRAMGLFLYATLIIGLIWQVVVSGFFIKFPVLYDTADGSRTRMCTAFFPLGQWKNNCKIDRRVVRMSLVDLQHNRVFWVNWDYYGIFNYLFSRDAVKITTDNDSLWKRKVYHLKNGTMVRVIEIRFDRNDLKRQDEFRFLTDEGYTSIFLCSDNIFLQIAGESVHNLVPVDNFKEPHVIAVRKKVSQPNNSLQ